MKNNMFDNLKAVVANTRANDIKMIDIDELHESADNFFIVENIEQFAQTILGQGGVKDNLIVRPLETGGYEIISGHRRRAAVQYLLDKGEDIVRVLPCLVQNYADDDEKMLDLILMNVSARQISDPELWKCYEKIDKILKERKDKGEYFGRIRDDIAATLGVSASQIGKMQNIDKNAVEPVKEAVASGELSISTANEIAKLDEEQQNEIAATTDLSTVTPKEIKNKATSSVKWDGVMYADIIKERLLEWLDDEEKVQALSMENNEFTDLIRKNHRTNGYCHDDISIDGNYSKVTITFYKPQNDIKEITLTWTMAARHIRMWLKEEQLPDNNSVVTSNNEESAKSDYLSFSDKYDEQESEMVIEKPLEAEKPYNEKVDINIKFSESDIQKEHEELMNWANSLSDKQLDFLCDGGWYNNTIRGYLISAAQNADFSNEQIKELLNGLRLAFSLKNKEDAEKISNNF